MSRFRDWPLRHKLVTTSAVLVVAVTLSMLSALYVTLHQLRRHAIPNQRVILSLESRSYDYLSEVREYVLTAETQTLSDAREIAEEMSTLLDEYDRLHDQVDPEALMNASNLRQQVTKLHQIGWHIVEIENRLREALEDAEAAEQALVTSRSLDVRHLLLAVDFLAELHAYVRDLEPETSNRIAELQQTIMNLRREDPLPDLLDLLTAGQLALSLRQELGETLEDIEEGERHLGVDLDNATALAAGNVAEATRRLVVLVVVTGVLGLALAGLVAVWLASRIARPIELLRDAAQRFAGGDLETRAPIESNDELGQLCGSFNLMAADIERLVKELQESLDTLRQSQVQLIQSGKMIAVGELAASVAHELNNPLSVVLTYAILMQEDCEPASQHGAQPLPSSFPERLELVKISAERCKNIIDGLLQFSRQDDAEYTSVDLADVLAKTFDLVGSQLRSHQVRWHLDLAPKPPPVHGNVNQLQQIFTNLALNAMQAMPSGGELTVTLPAPGTDDQKAGFCGLVFSDSGVGIPPNHLEHVFEPFFTTKAVGEGTGLGLSIVYGILQRLGGRISVESEVGQGTTFRLHLPLATTEATPQ